MNNLILFLLDKLLDNDKYANSKITVNIVYL